MLLTRLVPRRLRQRIHIRCLYFPTGIKETVGTMDHAREFREVRYLPQEFAYPNSMLIYRNKVAIFTSLQEFITVLIESEEIAQAERQKFEMLWRAAGA